MSNLTLLRLNLANSYNLSPLFNNFCIRIGKSMFHKTYSSIYYSIHTKSFSFERSSVNFMLNKVVIIQKSCINMKDENSKVDFVDISFCNVMSSGNGGCFLAVTSDIFVSCCNFNNCSTLTGFGGAFYIDSSCKSFIMQKSCFFLCSGVQSHGYRVECSNASAGLFVVMLCNKQRIGSYGSFLFSKANIANDFNSTNNLIERHGTGIYYFKVISGVSSRGVITQCEGMAIEMLDSASNCIMSFHNLVNNTCTNHGILFSSVTNNHWKNCLFIKNINTFLYTKASFYDCSFDFGYYNTVYWITGNVFSVTSYSTISIHHSCIQSTVSITFHLIRTHVRFIFLEIAFFSQIQ